VILRSPKIGERVKGTATRLMYQLVGPFELIKYLGSNAYQLRKVGIDKLSTHNVKHMNPYLSKERHKKELSSPLPLKASASKLLPADDMPAEAKQFIPKPGDFMLYTGFGTKKKPFHLVKVIQFVEAAGEVEFQW
jgi:hypothetical protein